MSWSARFAARGVAMVALVWLGLLLGVSFIATPAKFLAPSLTLRVALDVGRHTFGIFSIVESLAAAALLVCTLTGRAGPFLKLLAALLASCVALQVLWLLPVLDARVESIVYGATPRSSALHAVYIGLDLGKVLLLTALGWLALGALQRPAGGQAAR